MLLLLTVWKRLAWLLRVDSDNLFVPEEPVGELNPRCGECKGDPYSNRNWQVDIFSESWF